MSQPTTQTTTSPTNAQLSISHLSKLFGQAQHRAMNASGIRVAVRDNIIYKFQVEFAYLLNDIMRSPAYIVPKYIMNTHEFIRSMDKQVEDYLANQV